jgi:hypothetical protein
MNNKIAELGRKFYEDHLKKILEPDHIGEFVSIEPESGQYFLGRTGGEAIAVGNRSFPDKILFLARIGYKSAYKIGGFYANRDRKAV